MTVYLFLNGFVTILGIRMKVSIWLGYLKHDWIFQFKVSILYHLPLLGKTTSSANYSMCITGSPLLNLL